MRGVGVHDRSFISIGKCHLTDSKLMDRRNRNSVDTKAVNLLFLL